MARSFKTLLIIFLSFFVSCSSIPYIYETNDRYDSIPSRTDLRPADRAPLSPTKIAVAKRMPWETWPFGRDMQGLNLTSATMVQADEYLRNEQRTTALDLYKKALKTKLSPQESEALAIRTAGVELSLDKPSDALKTLSNYFKSSGKIVEDVDSRFSLLFAYSYGRNGDVEQSLAWFSRTNRLEAGRGGIAEASSRGLKMLLKSLSDQDFQKLDPAWNTDSFVSNLIGQERRRRSHLAYNPQPAKKIEPFWEEGIGFESHASIPQVRSGQLTNIGVLLPLSGKYSALGKNTLNGIKIAEKARGANSGVSLIAKDTKGDAVTAAVGARELLTVNSTAVFLGPLLAEPSAEVGRSLAGSGAPIISFSKKSDFAFARGMFRLGPTTESQVYSLVETVSRVLGIKSFALLYPQNELGIENATFFREAVRDNGATLLYDSAFYPNDTASFIKAANDIMQQNVEAVFIPDSIRNAAAFVTNIPESQRKNIRILGPASWDNTTQLNRSLALLHGAVFVSPFFVNSQRLIIKQFIDAYKGTYKKDPDFLAAQGFDAATLMFAAVDRAVADNVSVEAAIEGIDLYEGLTGQITVDPNGNLNRKFSVVEVTKKGLAEIIDAPSASISAEQEVPFYKVHEGVKLEPISY
ncbi:MAG: penicillin-binding protein activator [Bdellovibrionales bacterium]|nr:penicillin-binding protein activator [Bdellovibrionales bacterium]